jgi:hypothetical protein
MNPRRAAASEDLETVEASIDQIVASIKTNGNLGLRRTEQNLVDLTRLVLEEDEGGRRMRGFGDGLNKIAGIGDFRRIVLQICQHLIF